MRELPIFLQEKLKHQYGELWLSKIVQGYQKKKTSFRVNHLKATMVEVEECLTKAHMTYEKIEFLDAFLLKNETAEIQKLSLYQEGKIYLQSISSMLPVLFLDPKPQESILDMAAAPGGKTTQIASLTKDRALLTACEKNRGRLERLKYNIQKQGVTRITILKEDARSLDEFFSFDKILLDAPCSGSGTIILEDPSTTKYLSEELVLRSSKTQLELLRKAVSLLKKDGILIYSTCSILEEENEKNIEEILKDGQVELVPIDDSHLELLPTKVKGTLVLLPTDVQEGFFVAKLRKK